MNAKVSAFEVAYRHSLLACLTGVGEVALQQGYELGRQAMRDGLGVMDIVSAQQEVLQELLAGAETVGDCIRIVKSSQDLFTECLAPFELTHRGFLDMEFLNNKLEAANKELESFSYSVSHDLRAPLRAIDGYSRMILKRQERHFDEETRRQFHSIRNNVGIMDRLIEDLLAFSRFGKQGMSKISLDMEGIIKDVWQNLLTINHDRNMTLRIEELRPGIGDRSLIREVISNLLGNAVKFTRNQDMTLIEWGSFIKDNETVYYIRDNGVGFDMEYHDKLFGVFQRLHSVDQYEGTGIGLAHVQRIIHRHGGRVWAEGRVDEGATFYFTLPQQEID
ncbi:MAG: ATP-binding protein [Syntrophales bacterium]|jgi:two-component system sensor kinase|nr:ATP-binding protein [Syntrophales bacterium]MCK9391500.1 ATP-binding protein [Syntrophales bacterium]